MATQQTAKSETGLNVEPSLRRFRPGSARAGPLRAGAAQGARPMPVKAGSLEVETRPFATGAPEMLVANGTHKGRALAGLLGQ